MTRAARSMSPAAMAWRTARAGNPWSAYQIAARWWSSGSSLRVTLLELDREELSEEVVIAIPLAPLVERGDEDIGALELGEPRRRAGLAGDRVREPAADRVDDRGRQHEPESVRVEGHEHLLGQVVDDVPVRCTEGLDEPAPVRDWRASTGTRGRARPASPRFVRGGSRRRRGRAAARGIALRNSSDSSGANCRSVARNSSNSPVARSRAIGSGGSVRAEIATWMPGGDSSMNRIIVSWQSSLSRRW